MITKLLTNLFVLCLTFLSATASWASCVRITATNTNQTSASYTEPGKGDVMSWVGAADDKGSAGSVKGNINLSNDTPLQEGSFMPDGTLLASGVVDFVSQMGDVVYTPETILFRCTPDEEGQLFEYYATNGDATYGGNIKVGDSVGLEETYQSSAKSIGIRLTNLSTGEYYSRYWKSRKLTDLDRDSKNYILVKAKNFSSAKIELFKISASKGNLTGLISYTQPAAYTAFKNSSGISNNLADGADSSSRHDSWYSYWPGAVTLHKQITVTQINSCKLTQSTPRVSFPTMSAAQLSSGETSTQPIDITFICQSPTASGGYSGFVSGVYAGQTAIGFIIPPENAGKARSLGLSLYADSVSHLVSNGYGVDSSVATGIGVRITNESQKEEIPLADNTNSPGGADGVWYPVLMDASKTGESNSLSTYQVRYYAKLERLTGQRVTPGQYHATLQVVIKVM